MAPTPLGLDLNYLKNMTAPVIDFPTDPIEILNKIPIQANTITNGWIAMIMLIGLFIITYFILSDKSNFTRLLYSDLRSVCISFGVCSIMGLAQMQINYFYDFSSVAIFVVLFTLSSIALLIVENKE